MKKSKQQKVYYGHYSGSYKRHPVIRLKGLYLEEVGFKVGDMIQVTVEKGRIVISKI